jgi:hypothetical protein
MRAWEITGTKSKKVTEALAMREYAHPEEYLIRDGVDAGVEILQDFKEDLRQPETLNVKWDGKAAIFWGRDDSGEFFMIPNNQWNKGLKLSQEELSSEIKNTGRKQPSQSDEQFAAVRQQMADSYSAQWQMLEKSSPKKGFFWGDIMFDSPPSKNDQGQYEFTPNKVTYTADPTKELGKAIANGAKLFITVHGLVSEFGVDPTSDLRSVSQQDLSQLNKGNANVYLLSERPEQQAVDIDSNFIDQAIAKLATLKGPVDQFISHTAPKFTGFKGILRDYINSRVKIKGKLDFDEFLKSSKLSSNQQAMAMDFVSNNQKGMQNFIHAVDIVLSTKDRVLTELQRVHSASMANRLGITSSIGGKPGGEGYAKIRKSGSGIKYINPEFRSAPINARFSG